MLINFKDKHSLFLLSKAKKKYDIQIIGAGIIGISISNFLLKYKSNLKILLIERGRFINKAQAKKQNNTDLIIIISNFGYMIIISIF